MKNPFYRVALQQAKKMITNPKKTNETVKKAFNKSGKLKNDRKSGKISGLKENLVLFFSMIADFITGKYKKLPIKTAIKILAAILYFLFIVDLIPDFLTIIGLTDDAAVLAWVIKSVSKDIEKYKEWKGNAPKNSIDDTEVLTN